jgi:cytochrome c553
VLQQVEQAGQPSRPRAPPTCTNCHEKGHKRTQCTTR